MAKIMDNYYPKRMSEMWKKDISGEISILIKQTYKLNSIASAIWELCTGFNTVQSIATKIANMFNASDIETQVLVDVKNILKSWEYDDLVILNYDSLHACCNVDYQQIYDINLYGDTHKNPDVLFLFPPTALPMSYGSSTSKLEPLGIGYLASYIKQFDYHSALSNMWYTPVNKKTIEHHLLSLSPKVLAISSMTDNFINAVRIAEIAKEVLLGIPIVLGGVHATFEYKNILEKYSCFDYIIRGEGEVTFKEFLDSILRNLIPLHDILGLSYRINNNIINNEDRPFCKLLDTLPFPVRPPSCLTVGIQTSRGCTGKCIFCCASGLSGGQYRMRSADNVVDEIQQLVALGYTNFIFQDDTATVHTKRMRRIISLLNERNIKITWSAESRVDTINRDRDLYKLMAENGCNSIQFGIEAGSQKMLDALKKGIQIEDIYDAVKTAAAENISVVCSFLIGHPFETIETINETLELSQRLSELGAKCILSAVCPYPGTEIRQKATEYGIVIHSDDFSNYNILNPIMDTQYLTKETIRNLYYDSMLTMSEQYKQYHPKAEKKQIEFQGT